MNFTKNSWHVKLNREYGSDKAKNAIYRNGSISLCEYVNSTIGAILKLLLLGLAIVVLIWLITAGAFFLLFMPLVVAFCELANISQFLKVNETIFMALGADLLVAIVLFRGYCNKHGFKVFPNWWPKALIPKSRVQAQAQAKIAEPSIVMEWIKAKHAKFCPMIQFKVEEKE